MTALGPELRDSRELQQYVIEIVSVRSLLSFGSPRLAGEDPRHSRALAETDIPLPPIVVHRPTMHVIDGLHRVRAALLRGDEHIEARFFDGSPEDAFVLAVKLNTRHGRPLSQADRTAAAARIIGTHPHWSDRRIAEIAGISPSGVGALRTRSTVGAGQLNTRTGRDGRVRPLNAAEARRRAGEFIAGRPEASLREIAEAAGIAVATARDVRKRLRMGEDPVPPKLRAAEWRDADVNGTHEAKEEGGTPEPPPVIGSGILSSMRKDPALRFTDSGRTLLHLLSSQALEPEKWRWLAEGVPTHRAYDVVRAARRCAEQWLRFATELEQRGREG
ncbi:putative regulatory protein [Streptomyces sp. NBRC 110611]|uniref:ParB/RepB/Spo0J family partition protein n=1 Tax=Streptomyces sp. NBRC 110611 TaxID=1621259 RepID=UPI0008335BEE|nr:ParB/RepB/Spo0J family partition protein [Streptomyces sp. NBRC 110611]GAU68952.1 putative regulatory protein [Streptomyces sp. NBRC 110611]